MIGVGKVVTGVAMVVVLVGTAETSLAAASVPVPAGTDRAVVERVVDGDTVDVRLAGVMRRIRLLNIDTPETVDPHRPVECLGLEASTFVKNLLPTGTEVALEYDEERLDRYDRTLAAIYTPNGTLVNAEVARQGLAAVLVVGDNDRFYPPVERARDEAIAAHRGLYATDVACTVPAQVNVLTRETAAAPGDGPQASSTQLDANADAAARMAAATVVLQRAFTTSAPRVMWSALPAVEQQRLAALVAALHEKAQRTEADARAAAGVAREREAAAARADEQRRQERAREDAAERAEQQAAAARRRAEAEAKAKAAAREKAEAAARAKAAAAAREDHAAPKAGGATSGGGPWYPKDGGPPGYTGHRCFAPGGKMWRPC